MRSPSRRSPKNASAPRSPVVLITGASQGIGASIARGFAAGIPGVRLALVARNEGNLRKSAIACGKAGASAAHSFACDVTVESAVREMAAAVLRKFGRVDVLVNNAGIFEGAPITDLSAAQFDRVVAASLRSTFLVTRAFLPGMLERGSGDIFNMSSIAGRKAYPGGAAYCAAKYAVTGFTAVLREETKGKGIRVCGIHPGATWTPSWEKSGVEPSRMMPAEDITRAILDVFRLSRRTVVEEIVLRPVDGDV